MSNSETPTTTVASDWLVSVTPTPRGDWQLPGGPRFNLTIHNGATPDDVTAALATLAAIGPALLSAYESPSAPPAGYGGTSTPPPVRQTPPQPEGVETEDVYNVGHIQVGGQFDVEIERAVKTATGGGKPKLDLYRPENQYPFATVNEGQFDAFHAVTGVHGATLEGTATFNPAVMLRFKVGKKKQKSEKHYIDFVGAPTQGSPAPAPASNGGQVWNRTEVVNALTEKYPKWEPLAVNDALNRVETTPGMSNEQVIAAFDAKVAAATDPKAPAG